MRAPELANLNKDSLKKAYFSRAHECHPDKAASLGVEPEILTVKFRSLQDAWDDDPGSLRIGRVLEARF